MTRDEFEATEKELAIKCRKGDGPMALNAADIYRVPDGRYIVHDWGMGGESFTVYETAAALAFHTIERLAGQTKTSL